MNAKRENRPDQKYIKTTPGGAFNNVITVMPLTHGDQFPGTLNSRGKGKAKFNNRPTGDSGVASATWGSGAVGEKEYACP